MRMARDRYERAVWELSRAQQEHDEAKHALEAELYAADQGPPDPDECQEDMG